MIPYNPDASCDWIENGDKTCTNPVTHVILVSRDSRVYRYACRMHWDVVRSRTYLEVDWYNIDDELVKNIEKGLLKKAW